MKLDEATAVLRPRSSWEAIDLGCALARRHWGKLMRGWLAVALPLWALLVLVLHDHPGWVMFLMWLTKPLLTRQPIYFLSRTLFGAPPRIREFFKDWRRSLLRGLPAALTVKRLAFQRSFRLPVIILEGQTGSGYSRRVDVLSSHGGGSAAWLSCVALHLELVVASGLLLWLGSFMREDFSDWVAIGQGDFFHQSVPDWYYWLSNGCYAVAIALIEPIYGAAGFALYINSRTHLEGWDIEVAFRRMSSRLTPVSGTTAALIVCLGGMLLAAPVQGQETPVPRSDPKAVVEEVLKGPDFEVKYRKQRVKLKENTGSQKPDVDRLEAPEMDLRWLGFFIIGLAVLAVAIMIWKNRSAFGRNSRQAVVRSGPRVVMGMDLAPESLPEDLPSAAWREYLSGNHAAALRLLYRGALSWLVARAALPVHESDTEGDCLRHARKLEDAGRVSFFEALTASWVNCAYAGLPPAAEPMKRMCEQWPFSQHEKARAKTPGMAAAAAWLLPPLSAMLLLQGCAEDGKAEYVDIPTGYKGEARVNPWLAAERMLNTMGVPAETAMTLGTMPDVDTALFIPLDTITSRGAARQMLSWVAAGGHLIVGCTDTDRFWNDWTGRSEETPDSHNPLLQELRVTSGGSTGVSVGVSFPYGRSLRVDSHDASLNVESLSCDVTGGTEKSAVVASAHYLSGRITLLASAEPFRNRWIGESDHAAVLYQLVRLKHANAVIFLTKSRLNLWQMLMQNAWMPLVAAVLLTLLWLWRNLPRFGPALRRNDLAVRNFGSQLDEAGEFLAERAGPAALLAPARRSVLHAAAQRGMRPEDRDFIPHLAARTGLPAADIQRALFDDSAGLDVISASATLQKLLQNPGAGQ